jgi:PPM family protein phosphatase
MQIKVWCQTDKGLKRESNQDTFLVNEDLGLYIVADGMGGHSGGEVASQLAVTTAENTIEKLAPTGKRARDIMAQAYMESSRTIFDKALLENPELEGMGTTMVAAFFHDNTLFIGNVGDSRAYLHRKPYLWQITEDHSLVNEQLRSGLEIKGAPVGKNIITRSVGFERDVLADIIERPLQEGDNFLLCSDGFSGLVPDNRIAEILNITPQKDIVTTCIDEALKAGGQDNITVLYLSVTI